MIKLLVTIRWVLLVAILIVLIVMLNGCAAPCTMNEWATNPRCS